MDEIDIDKKIAAIRLKNSTINSRHEEIERDKRIAKEQGAAIVREQNRYVRPESSEDYNFVGDVREDERDLHHTKLQHQEWRYKSPIHGHERSDPVNQQKSVQEDCRQIIERRRAEAERLRRNNNAPSNWGREWDHIKGSSNQERSIPTFQSRSRTVISTATVMPPEFVDAAVEELRVQLQTARQLDADPLQFAAEAALTFVDKRHRPVQKLYGGSNNEASKKSQPRLRGGFQNNKDGLFCDEYSGISLNSGNMSSHNRSISQQYSSVDNSGNVINSNNGNYKLHDDIQQQLSSKSKKSLYARGRGRLFKDREKRNDIRNDEVGALNPEDQYSSKTQECPTNAEPMCPVILNVFLENEPADSEFLHGRLEFINKHRQGHHQRIVSKKSDSSTGSEHILCNPVVYDLCGEYIDDELADIEQLLLKVEDPNFTLLDVDIDEPISSWAREVSLEEARLAAEARLTAVSQHPKEQQTSPFNSDVILQQLQNSNSVKKNQS